MSAIVKFYGTRSHAARRQESLEAKFAAQTNLRGVTRVVLKEEAGYCVGAELASPSSEVRAFLESEKLKIVVINSGDTPMETKAVTTYEDPAPAGAAVEDLSPPAPEDEFDSNDEAQRREVEAATQAEKDAKTSEKERIAQEKAKARKERQDAVAASRAEVARVKAEVKARKAAEKAASASMKAEAAKKPAAARPAGESSAWKDSFAKAPYLIAKKLLAGKPPFREGTKRALFHDMLTQGATVEQLIRELGWNRATVQSSLYEMAHLMARKVEKDEKGIYTYR